MRYAEIIERYRIGFASENEVRWAVEELLGRRGFQIHRLLTDLPIDQSLESYLIESLDEWAERRLSGEPLQYLIGHWPFAGLDLICDPRALIPRPETEGLVEIIISDLGRDKKRDIRILDLGCGTGAIGLALAATNFASHVVLADLSEVSCTLTRENLRRNIEIINCEVEVIESNWFDRVPKVSYDLIVSNPPYIRSSDIKGLQLELAMEPVTALDGGEDGVEPYRLILDQASDYLSEDGTIYFEIGFDQGKVVSEIARGVGFGDVSVVRDFASQDRYVVCAKLNR
ncbi:MAG: peptide chain release factor N(5)-glutamine methyltransferase [Actinomycetota bacterium]|nr:peptide chain release factor N(5)-glutamine methyltransferase [Actinomycetota bacterium]